MFTELWNQGDGLGEKATEAGVFTSHASLEQFWIPSIQVILPREHYTPGQVGIGYHPKRTRPIWNTLVWISSMAFHEPSTWKREVVGSEKRVSGYIKRLFFIIEVFGAIHTGYSWFQSLGSGAAVNHTKVKVKWQRTNRIGDDQLPPGLPNPPSTYSASDPQDKFILAICFFLYLLPDGECC